MWVQFRGEPPQPVSVVIEGAKCCGDDWIRHFAGVQRTGSCQTCPYVRFPNCDCWWLLRRDTAYYFCGRYDPGKMPAPDAQLRLV